MATERVSNLYEANVPLQVNSDAGQRAAISDALRVVLEKLSGSNLDLVDPQNRLILNQASQYVFEFGSTQFSQIAENGVSVEEIDGLWVKFDQQKIDELMANTGMPIWPSTRPEVLFWLVTETAPGSYFYMPPAAEPAGNLRLNQIAEQRGLPLLQPSYNSIEQLLMPASEAWQLNEAVVSRISTRYESDVLAVIRYRWNSNGMVEGDLRVISEDDVEELENSSIGEANTQAGTTLSASQFSTVSEANREDIAEDQLNIAPVVFANEANSLPQLLDILVTEFVDGYALERTFLPIDGREIVIQIEGVDNFLTYHNLIKGFGSMEMLQSVSPKSLEGDLLWFSAKLSSDPEIMLHAATAYMGLRYIEEEEIGANGANGANSLYRFHIKTINSSVVSEAEGGGDNKFEETSIDDTVTEATLVRSDKEEVYVEQPAGLSD